MHRLLHRLVHDLGVQPQHRSDAARRRGAEVGDVVDAVRVQADALDQGDVDLVGGDDAPQQVRARAPGALGHRQQGRDVVPGVGVVRGEVGVVEVQLAHGRAVGPGRPLRRHAGPGGDAEDRRAGGGPVAEGLGPGDGDRAAAQRGHGDRGVVDDPVDRRRRGPWIEVRCVLGAGGHDGQLPGELLLAGQAVGAGVYTYLMVDHGAPRSVRWDGGTVGRWVRRRSKVSLPLPEGRGDGSTLRNPSLPHVRNCEFCEWCGC